MDKQFQQAEQNNADTLSQRIEQAAPAAKISNLGWLVLCRLENGSIFTLTPLTSETCDLNGTDCHDQKHELQAVAWDDALKFLQDVATLQTEEATPPGVAGYSPTNAFAAPGQTSNRGVEQSKREGWQVMNEIDRLKDPFGQDPLGANERNPKEKSRSEGKRKSAISHNFENGSPLSLGESAAGNETLYYLREMLPVDSGKIDGNKLTVTIDAAAIVIAEQANGHFGTECFVGGDLVQQYVNIPAGDLIRWAFQICGMLQSKVAERDNKGADVEPNDVWQTIRELAKENGESDDILRNPALFDLKQGLPVARPPLAESVNHSRPVNETPAIHGSATHGGKPVSINEHRDVCKPYADTLGGKVLVHLPGTGATLVPKAWLPKQRFLSWNSSTGQVELVEGKENVKRPSWHFRGWKH